MKSEIDVMDIKEFYQIGSKHMRNTNATIHSVIPLLFLHLTTSHT